MMEPVQRDGAGVVDLPSGTNAGPVSAHRPVSCVSFAVVQRKSRKSKAKVIAAVAEHLGEIPGVVVVDELPDDVGLRLTVALDPPRRPVEAAALAVGCPHYVPGTFAAVSG